jgi:hypothetical protein
MLDLMLTFTSTMLYVHYVGPPFRSRRRSLLLRHPLTTGPAPEIPAAYGGLFRSTPLVFFGQRQWRAGTFLHGKSRQVHFFSVLVLLLWSGHIIVVYAPH